MADKKHLPIKVVTPREHDFRQPERRGDKKKLFPGELDPLRLRLLSQLTDVDNYFDYAFSRWSNIPGVAKVKLVPDALAKSHRPDWLFNENTCPVIGVLGFGELLISVTKRGLHELGGRLRQNDTHVAKASISTLQSIEPFTSEDALAGEGEDELKQIYEGGGKSLKLRLFRHDRGQLNQSIENEFSEYLKSLGVDDFDSVNYGKSLSIYRITPKNKNDISEIVKFVGVQSLSPFPSYGIVRTTSIPIREATTSDFPPPDTSRSYPVIGVIDSGINPDNSHLKPWVANQYFYHPEDERDYGHGSFVGGLIVNGRHLNHSDERFPETSAKLVDVVALPKSNSLSEDELLAILDEVIPKHPEVKVWNLSLGAGSPCDVQSFSDLGMAFDDLQDKYDVTFVVSSGNYQIPPFRGWPSDVVGDDDRVSSPADSTRCITVGSLAHIDRANSRVKNNEPSPFSRRGPGPVFIPKPEVTHYGGNCDKDGQYPQTGVLSLDGDGRLAENIGTSFSTPLVATLMANIGHSLIENPSRNLLKALLVHSAVLNSDSVKADELKYKGFGVPSEPHAALSCSPWSTTLIFESEITSGIEFEKWPFPLPDSLRNESGAFYGEVAMTLVYDPPLDSSYGAEYCRTNVDVSLGTYDVDNDGKRKHHKEIPVEPSDASKMYEHELLEHGFKWSPVKVYRRIIPRGVKGDTWRLKVSMQNRAEYLPSGPQKFALIVTISDPKKEAQVYNDVIALMNKSGWITNDLQIQEQIRNIQ